MREIVRKWYGKLNFPAEYDGHFNLLLETCRDSDLKGAEDFFEKPHTAAENLIACLYFCEELEKRYREHGIGEEILLSTLSDIVIWTRVRHGITGELGIGETNWLKRHLSFNIFRLGRLQFAFGKFEKDYPSHGIAQGDNALEVHIPEDGKLSVEECKSSFSRANEFFPKYFPDFRYKYFSCYSWLLDGQLKGILGDNSNICRFADMFEIVDSNKSDSILKYIFRWDATRDNIDFFEAKTSLQRTVKDLIRQGRDFYESYGIRRR